MVKIATSLLNAKQETIIQTLYALETAHTDFFHIDVMDGEFVENNTNKDMQRNCEHLLQVTNLPIDVHLMVKDVKSYINSYLAYKPDRITFHWEAVETKEDVMELIQYIRDNHCKVGISIKPNTKVEEIKEILPYVNMVLVMTVEPGKGGQSLIEETITKIEELYCIRKEEKLDYEIEADGGIKEENIAILKEAGVDIAVVGSAILKQEDYKQAIQKLKEITR